MECWSGGVVESWIGLPHDAVASTLHCSMTPILHFSVAALKAMVEKQAKRKV